MDQQQKQEIDSRKKFGPGTWYSMHLLAAKAITPERKKAFAMFIEVLRESFFCALCRKHFNIYCENHPLPLDDPNPKALFEWSVNAHNNANMIVGNPIVSLFTAENMFYNAQGICTAGCDEEPEKVQHDSAFLLETQNMNSSIELAPIVESIDEALSSSSMIAPPRVYGDRNPTPPPVQRNYATKLFFQPIKPSSSKK